MFTFKIDCNKCMYGRGTATMCWRVTSPYSSRWMNKSGNCKEFIKRWSFGHLWYLIISNI